MRQHDPILCVTTEVATAYTCLVDYSEGQMQQILQQQIPPVATDPSLIGAPT